MEKKNVQATLNEMITVCSLKPFKTDNLPVEAMQAMIENFYSCVTYSNFYEVIKDKKVFSDTSKELFKLMEFEEPKPKTKEEKAKAKELKEASTETEKKERYTRIHAFYDSLKKGGKKEELIKEANQLWKDKNKDRKNLTEDMKIAELTFNNSIVLCKLFNLLEEKQGVFNLVGKQEE